MNFISKTHENKNAIFQGIWLRTQALTQAEKVVCLGIILIPIWWVIGWGVMLLLWMCAIVFYELKTNRKIRLSPPNIEVIGIILFSFYRSLSYGMNSPEIAPRVLIDPLITWGCVGILLWYIQSNNIRVRLQPVAWAFSFTICMMILWWIFCHFVIREPYYTPPRTLYAVLTDKGAYNPANLGSVGNFLVPYYLTEKGFGGLYRHNFFFPHPTVSSFAIGFAGLIALDLKNLLWSRSILAACTLLILIAQARNAWLSLSVVLVVRWILTTGKTRGITFMLALFAIASFATFSVPSVTNYIADTYSNTVETTSNFRKESTEGRQKIYQRTWESFIEEPLWGHGVNGPSVVPGYEFAGLGSESFILGTLLYKSGLVGTGVFLAFYISLLVQLCKTRKDRPLCCFLMLLYFTLASSVTEFLGLELFLLLLCTILQKSHINQGKQSEFSIHKFPMS